MSNYGKPTFYKVSDIRFEPLQSISLESITLIEYYQQKYKIDIKKANQPLLVAEGRKKEEPILLVP